MTPARSDRLGIGAVLARLQEEFPDVSLSKIRFLEAEGLINPERTASGYRKFTSADVERLRFVLAAQRDRFWPLKVIRDALDAMDRGLPVDADTATSRPSVPAASLDPELPGPASLAGGDGPRGTNGSSVSSRISVFYGPTMTGSIPGSRLGSPQRRPSWPPSASRHAICGRSGLRPIERSG